MIVIMHDFTVNDPLQKSLNTLKTTQKIEILGLENF